MQPLSQEELETGLSGSVAAPPQVLGAMISRQIDSDDVLRALRVPVLVSHGRQDQIVSASMAEHVLQVCPTARRPGTTGWDTCRSPRTRTVQPRAGPARARSSSVARGHRYDSNPREAGRDGGHDRHRRRHVWLRACRHTGRRARTRFSSEEPHTRGFFASGLWRLDRQHRRSGRQRLRRRRRRRSGEARRPGTGRTSTVITGLPQQVGPYGGPVDVAFVGRTAYVLVTLVSPDVGRVSIDGIYRIDAPGRATPIADVGACSITHPPATDFFVPSGVLYALQPFWGGFLVSDGHHN